MDHPRPSTLNILLQGVSWFLFVVGGLSFWVGGKALHEFAHVDRLVAEVYGFGIAAVCAVLGFAAKSFAENP